MRPDPGDDGRSRPDTPVSATTLLEVAAGLRDLDPHLSAELARHAARLAGADGDLRGAAERVAARSLAEALRGVEVVERTVPTLRSALGRGAHEDEILARCDLAWAAVRCRATALAVALIGPLEDAGAVPPAWHGEVFLRVAQVRAAEGDVDGTDLAAERAREDGPGRGTTATLFEADLGRARGEARRRRGDAAGCVAVLADLRGRLPDTTELDGGRRATALLADHVAALVDAGALDDARATAAAATPATAATALGVGRLQTVVAGRLLLPATPDEAEALAWHAERDLADGAHHREAADAARVVAEAAELRGRWSEALAALRRARAHDGRAQEEERSADRLLAEVLGYGEGMTAARAAPLGAGDEVRSAADGSRPQEAPRTPGFALVPELAVPTGVPGPHRSAPSPERVAADPGRRSGPGRRRRVVDGEQRPDGPSDPPRDAAAEANGTGGGRRRRRDSAKEPADAGEAGEAGAATPPSRPRHGRRDGARADAVRADAVRTDAVRTDAVRTDAVRMDTAGADAVKAVADGEGPGSGAPAVDAAAEAAATGSGGSPADGDGRRDGHGERGPTDAFSTAPEPSVPGGSDGGRPSTDHGHDDALGIGWLLARSDTDPGAPVAVAGSPSMNLGVPESRPASDSAAPGTGEPGSPARALPSRSSERDAAPGGDAEDLPLTLAGILAEYDLPDVLRPAASAPTGPTGPTGPAGPRPVDGRDGEASAPASRVGGAGGVRGLDGDLGRAGAGGGAGAGGDAGGVGGAGDPDGGARLADLLADAMDAFRRVAPDTAGAGGREGTPGRRSRP